MRLVNWRSLAIAAAGFGLAACGDDVTVQPTPITFTTNPSAVSCVAGQPTAVGVTVQGGTGTPTVTFQQSGSVFTGTGTATGNTFAFTCGSTAGAGAITFTITSGGQTVTGSIPVTVTAAANPVVAVVVQPSTATVVPGGTVQLIAQVTLASGAPANTATTVTWTSSDTTVATVNANGLVTTRTTAAGRSAVITAASTAAPSVRASSAITVGQASSLVSGLTVSPGAVTLSTGQTQQITSNVTLAAGAPAGTSTAVTYTSSDTSIAKVSNTGVITAGSRAGVATITVASVAAPTVLQTIGVTVTQLAPVRLTIQGLQTFTAAGQAQTADQNNIVGRLVATLNLDPGSFTPDSVVATLGGNRVLCQRFTAQLAQALRSALTDGSADFAPIQCTINTAAFNPTTGVALAQNGTQTLDATVYYRPVGGGAGTTQTATIPTQLTLNNQSGYFVSVTNTPTAAQVANGAPANGQATGPQGVLWRAGTLNVSVLPVSFTGAATGTGSQALAVTLSDVVSGQVASKTANFTPGTSFTVQFNGQTAAYTPIPTNAIGGCNQCLDGYTSPNADQVNGGTVINVGGSANTIILDANGNQVAGGVKVFVDNAYPEPRTQFVSQNFINAGGTGTQGFLNGNFVFADSVLQSAAATALADNNGVDRVSRTFFFMNNTAGSTAADILAANQSATNTNGSIAIPANTNPGTYIAAAKLADALGNAVPVIVNANQTGIPFQFGVSTAAPTASFAGSGGGTNVGANARIGLAQTTARNIIVTVASPVGFSATPLQGTLSVQTPNGTFCAVAADVVGNVLTGVSTTGTTGTCPTLNFTSVSIDPTTAMAGIYNLSLVARDVAGNVSSTLTRTFVIDRVAPTVANAVPLTLPLRGGQPAAFTAQATDNLNLVSQFALVNYATGAGNAANDINLQYNGNPVSTSAFSTPFTRSANLSITIPSLIRSINLASAGGAVTNYGTNTFVDINGIAVGVTDAGNNSAYAAFPQAASLLDQTQTSPVFFGQTNGLQNISITYTPNTTTTSAAAPVNLFASSANGPQSLTITVNQNGVANQPFQSPFQRIELYQRSATTGTAPFTNANAYTLIGTFSTGGLSVSPTSSRISSTFTVTPGSNGLTAFPSSGTSSLDLLVVLTDANGFAVAAIVPTITLAP